MPPSAGIALLGRCDEPTDALEDYCICLGKALASKGFTLDLVRMPWPEKGWLPALNWLRHESRKWKGSCVLVQYTALSWSRRGFSLFFLPVLLLLKMRNVRIAVVFHDPEPYSGWRHVDRIRRACQRWTMRCAFHIADKAVMTIPVKDVSWLDPASSKATFIPVGANIPSIRPNLRPRNRCDAKTIVVFGITGGGEVGNEVSDIAFAAKAAAGLLPRVRLVTLGRGSLESESKFRTALQGSTIEYSALGILSAEDVELALSNSDVSLFVRGCISTQRGSAIASIACAVPLVAYSGAELATPFSEAGVVPVPFGDRNRLAEATLNILTDCELWLNLHHRSQRSYHRYFAWEVVASRFTDLIHNA